MRSNAIRLPYAIAFLSVLAIACVTFGAIPWHSVPTLGQAIWASGFALSFANGSEMSIYATDFGLPSPAPIAFGLSATLLQAALLRVFSMSAMDAYTVTTVFYLGLSLWGATAYAHQLGATRILALSSGLLWLCLPLVIQHAGYSMLALGFALLPFYFYTLHKLLRSRSSRSMLTASAGFIAACVMSVFMDGYTFVMFAAASVCVLAGALATGLISRKKLLLQIAPIATFGFAVAYTLYGAYIGDYHFEPAPLDFFRGWGVDVAMLFIPSQGMHWFWDVLALSTPRSMSLYWGDASVWMTTFIAPLIATGVAGFLFAKERKYASILIAISLGGFYLSLGPSLKFHSTKDVAGITVAEKAAQMMPEKYAIGPTGSALLFEKLPGVNLMRATYRWAGLGALGLWALTILLLIRIYTRSPIIAALLPPFLIVLLAPHFGRQWNMSAENRENAAAMELALVDDLRGIVPGGILFFAPYGNDFIVNYLAPLSGFRSYNIGGDKNVLMAQQYWSETMLRLRPPLFYKPTFVDDLRTILLTGQADAIVIPYFDTLQAAIHWPPSMSSVTRLREQRMRIAREGADGPCFSLEEYPLFAAVKLTIQGRRVREIQNVEESAALVTAIRSCDSIPTGAE